MRSTLDLRHTNRMLFRIWQTQAHTGITSVELDVRGNYNRWLSFPSLLTVPWNSQLPNPTLFLKRTPSYALQGYLQLWNATNSIQVMRLLSLSLPLSLSLSLFLWVRVCVVVSDKVRECVCGCVSPSRPNLGFKEVGTKEERPKMVFPDSLRI